jgi:hypothetical protein
MGILYIVMGAHHTRKSTTIRALTGYTRGDRWQIALIDGNRRDVWIVPTSPQENDEAFERLMAAINRREVGPDMDILLALHPDGASERVGRIPDENKRTIRWALLGVEDNELSPNVDEILRNPDAVIPDSRDLPANEIAHQIRQVWRWL